MSKVPFLLFATTNPYKVREVTRYLEEIKVPIESLPESEDKGKYQESGRTFRENAQAKALYFHDIYGMPTLADDSGLVIDALGGEPGVHSSRYLGPDIPHSEKMASILERLKDLPPEERKAHFVCSLALVFDRRIYCCIIKRAFGYIADGPKGTNGFGYDPIFFSPELNCTFGEADIEVKNKVSHRGKAVQALVSLFETHMVLRKKLKLS